MCSEIKIDHNSAAFVDGSHLYGPVEQIFSCLSARNTEGCSPKSVVLEEMLGDVLKIPMKCGNHELGYLLSLAFPGEFGVFASKSPFPEILCDSI